MNNNNQIKYLDDSFVKIAQDKYKNTTKEELERIVHKSKEKSITNNSQKVNGRPYPGKNKKIVNFRKVATGTILAVSMIGLGSIYNSANKIIDYNAEVNRVVNENLSTVEQGNLENYQNVTESTLDKIKEPFEVLSQISDKEKELKATGDYKWGILNSQLTPDAISEVALENTNNAIEEMNEYVNGGQGYGK